jgi:hypothetical protein
MFAKRFGVAGACVLVLVLSLGVAHAGATAPTRVLKFVNASTHFVGIGFNANSNAIPPVGSRFAITLRIKNDGPQFGKRSGAIVGRVLIECTVLAQPSAKSLDGNCFGIAHVPDGFFIFEGGLPFNNAKTNYWAITGGAGAYADTKGQLKTGGQHAVATLYSP